MRCPGEFNIQHYNYLTMNKFYLLYYSISINIENEESYNLCSKLLDYMSNLNKELNEKFKSDKDEEAKESIKDKRFSIHFDSIKCMLFTEIK